MNKLLALRHFVNDIYLKVETTDSYDFYVLAKKATKYHVCANGYFYDWYEASYLEKKAYDYILYYDLKTGQKLDSPIEVKIEWRLNKDV